MYAIRSYYDINGQFKGAVLDNTSIQKTLDDILNKHKSGAANEVVQFVDNFEFKPGLYVENGIIDPQVIVKELTGQRQVETYYTAVEGDAPTSISYNFV